MKITRETFKNIVKETMIEESEYQEFFKRALEKTGKSIPDMSDEEKKAFFNKIDAAWQGKGEKKNEGQSVNEKSSDPFLDYARSKSTKGSKTRVDRVAKYGNYKFEFDDHSFIVSLLYNGKVIAGGFPDWSTGGYIMNHLSWGSAEKKFKSLEDIIKYFKSKKITTDGLEAFNEAANLKTISMLFQNKGIKDAVRKDHADKLRKIIEDSGVSTKGVSDSELIKVVKQLTSESVTESSISIDKKVTNIINSRDFKKFVNYFNSFYGKNGVYSSGKDIAEKDIIKGLYNVFKRNNSYEWGDGDSVDRDFVRDELFKMKVLSDKIYKNESVDEASKPTIKVVNNDGNNIKNEQGIQIIVVKTTKGEILYGGFVVRGKLQKVIPAGANKTKEDVKKRALQIWDAFGKQLGESESVVKEGKLGDTWKKNNKKGYILKVGNIELKSAGPSNSHDILIDRHPWGTFAIDYEAGGTDWWVKPMRGSDFWVKSIDDLVKRIKASK